MQTFAAQPVNSTMVVESQIHDRQVQIVALKHGEKPNLQDENFSSDENATENWTTISQSNQLLFTLVLRQSQSKSPSLESTR